MEVRLSELVAIALLLALAFRGLYADLLVVFLQRGKILASLRELALLHALADIPVDESTLAVHEIKLVVNARENLSNRGRVRNHAACAHHLSKVAARNDSRGLVIDATLEAGGAPVHELDSPLCLDGCHPC